jgi:uncharacterized GH25 family protein
MSRMKRSALVVAAFAFVVPGLAPAHDFWIEPSTFRPAAGEEVTAALRVGQKLQGEPLPLIPFFVDRFVLKGDGREVSIEGESGAEPAGKGSVPAAGLHWIGYQSQPTPILLEARKFEESLRDEGLERIVAERAKKGQSGAQGRERFSRCAKALLQSKGTKADASKGVFDTPLGFTLELVPRKNPYALRPGGELSLAVLFRGKAIANVLVVATSKDDPEKTVSARTDANGLVTLRLAHPGFWLVKAVHMESAPPDTGVDWESWWASVTFELAAAR